MKSFRLSPRALVAATSVAAALLAAASAQAHSSGVVISEWMYQSASANEAGEFFELTNTGSRAVDFSNWSYDDDSRNSLTFNLSAFGLVAAGESVIVTELDAAEFRQRWDLAATVKVIGNLNPNLGRNDEINLFDAELNLVDRLSYGDQNVPGSIRARYNSGRPGSLAALGANNAGGWVLSQVGDAEGSWRSTVGDIGSPGQTSFVSSVPEPETYALMMAGIGLVGAVVRRRRNAGTR